MRYELLKVFGNIKIMAVILGMFILSSIMAMKIDTIMFEGFSTDVYKYYMDYLEGEYTQEKHSYVFEEYSRLKEHISNSSLYDKQYKDKLISATEYRELSSAASLAKGRIKTFEYIVEKTEYYAGCENTPSYFYDIDVDDYIVNMSVNIPLLLSLILVIAVLFNEDYSANTVYMIRSSKDGKDRLLCRRLRIVVIIAIVLGVVFYVAEFLIKYFYLDLGDMHSHISSLKSMENAKFSGSIWGYLLTSIGIRMMYTVLVALLISVIAILTHKYMMTIGVALGVVYLPSVITDSEWALTAGLKAYPLINTSLAFIIVMVYILIFMGIIGILVKKEKNY